MGPTADTAPDGTRRATSLRESDLDDEHLWGAFEELDHAALESALQADINGHSSSFSPPVPNDICATGPGPAAPSAAISPSGREAANKPRSDARPIPDSSLERDVRSLEGDSEGSHATVIGSPAVTSSSQNQPRVNRESPTLRQPEKRGVGRPKGSGPKQQALAANPEAAPAKRRPGRPRKEPPPVDTSCFIKTMRLPGNTSASTSSSLAPIFGRDRPNSDSPSPSITAERTAITDPISSDPVRLVCPEPSSTNPVDGSASGEDILRDGSGCGIGEDNDEFGDGEEETEEQDGDIADSGHQPKRVRRPRPSWLMSAFNARVREAETRPSGNVPLLYSRNKTFWFPRQSSYFILKERSPTPQQLFNPRFFLWDPECLMPDGIACPNCKSKLRRHGHIHYPRRCIDLDEPFWIIGYRYLCGKCLMSSVRARLNGEQAATFQSWDPKILNNLPPMLRAEFPACLSHRSGLSKSLRHLLRSCIQAGMASQHFSDAVRVQHLLNYDYLHLQYLDELAFRQAAGTARNQTFKPFLAYEDQSDDGAHGFTPSSPWFSDVYASDAEERERDNCQHTSMLTAEVCAIDHSHKITKQLWKINGVEIFIGLLTVTNEKGEIRICNLVATKSHSQFELGLKWMRASIVLYGHIEPRIFYTDNMADKQFLEASFPTLLEDIVPVEKYAHLARLEIPDDWTAPIVRSSATSIEDDIMRIVDQIPDDGRKLTVGFDTEWSVDLSAGAGQSRGLTAVIQIAYGKQVYIFQVGKMLAKRKFPAQLIAFLANPKIQKAGRQVQTDLKNLQKECRTSQTFVGAVDLAQFAKERHVVERATVSLADLSASVLHKRMDKQVHVRVSTEWDNAQLSHAHVHYAALDAVASLLIYEELEKISVPTPLLRNPNPGQAVILYQADHTRIIAHGIISSHVTDDTYDGLRITDKRTIILVQRVLVPGAIVSTHHKRALSSFMSDPFIPFNLVCLRTHVRLGTVPSPQPASSSGSNTAATDPGNMATSFSANLDVLTDDSLSPCDDDSLGLGDLMCDLAESDDAPNGPSSMSTSSASHSSAILRDATVNKDSALQGAHALTEPNGIQPDLRKVAHSRVLKDPFHIFNMLYISRTHGLRVAFAHALRDAIFIPDAEDKARIVSWAASLDPPQTWDDIVRTRPRWLWRHCKRVIPHPKELYPLIYNVFRTYGPLEDAKTHLPLFNANAWRIANNVLSLALNGFITDPPDVPLYIQLGVDKKHPALPVYRCIRGTNTTEGGVHKHIRHHLLRSGVSVRHLSASLHDFVLHHNLTVGTFNSTGQPYRGHFDIGLTNRLQEIIILTRDLVPDMPRLTNWVNGNLYTPSNEVIGILPIPDELRHSFKMKAFENIPRMKTRHGFLASRQGTRKAVMPVHTEDEYQLFRTLMRENDAFRIDSQGPNFKDAARIWNQYAESEENIFYKVPEHIRAYYTTWKTNMNVCQTLTQTSDLRQPIDTAVRDHSRTVRALPVQFTSLHPLEIPAGLLPLEHEPSPEPQHRRFPMTHAMQPAAPSINPAAQLDMSHFASYPMPTPRSLPISVPPRDRPTSVDAHEPMDKYSAPLVPSSSSSTTIQQPTQSPAVFTVALVPTALQIPRQRAVALDLQATKDQLSRKRALTRTAPLPEPAKFPRTRSCRKCADGINCPGKNGVDRCRNPCKDCGEVKCRGRNKDRPKRTCETAWD